MIGKKIKYICLLLFLIVCISIMSYNACEPLSDTDVTFNVNVKSKTPTTNTTTTEYDYTTGQYIGCYVDNPNRDLEKWVYLPFDNTTNSKETCAQNCSNLNYPYFGLQYSSQCFCGNSYGRYGGSNESDCNYVCTGDSSQICGGYWRNSIYKVIEAKGYNVTTTKEDEDAYTTSLNDFTLYDKDGNTIRDISFTNQNVDATNNPNNLSFDISVSDLKDITITNSGISVGSDDLLLDTATVDVTSLNPDCLLYGTKDASISNKTLVNETNKDLNFSSQYVQVNPSCLSDIPLSSAIQH